MSAAFLATFVGLAIADSLNPFTVAAQAYLLGTPDPMRRSLAFLVATFTTYFLGGILLLAGLDVVVSRVLPMVPAWGPGAGELALGAMLIGFGVHAGRRAGGDKPLTPPGNLGIGATILFAVASTASDIPTAIPYFAAVSSIAAQGEGWAHDLLLLGLYNVVYCAPLIALVIARASLSPARSQRLFGTLRSSIDWAFASVLPWLLGVAGLALIVDGIRRLLSL